MQPQSFIIIIFKIFPGLPVSVLFENIKGEGVLVGFKLSAFIFLYLSPNGEDKHFIVVCEKCLLVPAVQQWGIKKADASRLFLTAFVFLITLKEAFNFFSIFFSEQQVLHRA